MRRALAATLAALVLAAPLALVATADASSPYRPDRASATRVSREVFGPRWRTARCIAWYESRWELAATNGANLGPWQINVVAHPWVNARRLTRSWRYSARVAYRISNGGRDWSAWTTAGLCK